MGRIKLLSALEWLPGHREGLSSGVGSQGVGILHWSPEPEVSRRNNRAASFPGSSPGIRMTSGAPQRKNKPSCFFLPSEFVLGRKTPRNSLLRGMEWSHWSSGHCPHRAEKSWEAEKWRGGAGMKARQQRLSEKLLHIFCVQNSCLNPLLSHRLHIFSRKTPKI